MFIDIYLLTLFDNNINSHVCYHMTLTGFDGHILLFLQPHLVLYPCLDLIYSCEAKVIIGIFSFFLETSSIEINLLFSVVNSLQVYNPLSASQLIEAI